MRITLRIFLLCAALSASLASPAWSAIAELSSQRALAADCSACDSAAVAYPGNVTAGNLLVVGGSTYDTAGTTSHSVTDTIGTTYTVYTCTALTASFPNSTPYIAIGIAPSSGANTVTVNPTIDASANKMRFGITEFSGVANPPLDVNGGSSTGTSTTPSDSITTATDNALILGLAAFQTSASITPGGSYTQITEGQQSIDGFNLEYRIATTAQAYTVDWTMDVNQAWSACTISVQAATSPASATLMMRRRMVP